MALKNKQSRGANTFEKIQKILSENGARMVMFDYASDGRIDCLTFSLMIDDNLRGFRMPAMVENVEHILFGGVDRYNQKKVPTALQKEQAYKTAWANIRDWLDAQMALVKTRQVKVDQVFLPYMIGKDNKTVYEISKLNSALLLGDGK